MRIDFSTSLMQSFKWRTTKLKLATRLQRDTLIILLVIKNLNNFKCVLSIIEFRYENSVVLINLIINLELSQAICVLIE